MADVNWNLAVTPDPFKQIAEGRDYSRSIFDQAALLKAGSQYAAGDPASAANTVAARGDFKTAGDLSTLATRRQAGQLYAGGDAAGAGKALAAGGDFETAGKLQEQQIKTIEAQQNALGKVGGFLDASGGAPDAWDWAARSLHAAGVQPDTIAKLQQQYATNPKQTIAQMKALADHKFTYQTSGGVTTQWDERGNLVQTVGENTAAPHVQNIIQGDQEQTSQWDPKTKQWVALGSPGPRYRPQPEGLTAGQSLAQGRFDQTQQQQRRQNAVTLRKEYDALQDVKTYRAVANSADVVKRLGQSTAPSDDMALIFAFMKALDPQSVVREGEFATAQNATGIPGVIVNAYNQALSGNKLNDKQRTEFAQTVNSIKTGLKRNYDNVTAQYKKYAADYGLPADTIQARVEAEDGAAPLPIPQAAIDKLQEGVETEFDKGRGTWTLQNGQPARVK